MSLSLSLPRTLTASCALAAPLGLVACGASETEASAPAIPAASTFSANCCASWPPPPAWAPWPKWP